MQVPKSPSFVRLTAAAIRFAIATAILLLSVSSLHALSLRSMTLAEQVSEAGRIVHGVVVETSSGRDESGISATWITVAVARTVKGRSESHLVFKQLGRSDRPTDGSLLHVADLPDYRVGDEVVLLLRPESRRGFTSPVGMGDGVFRVDRTTVSARVRDPGGGTKALEALLAELESLVKGQP